MLHSSTFFCLLKITPSLEFDLNIKKIFLLKGEQNIIYIFGDKKFSISLLKILLQV